MKKLYLPLLIITLMFVFGFQAVEAKCPMGTISSGTGNCNTVGKSNSDNRIAGSVDFSSSLMNFVNRITSSDHIGWRTSPELARSSSGDNFHSLVFTFNAFGLFPDNKVDFAESFGDVTLGSVNNLQNLFGIQSSDRFDKPTQAQFANFIDSFINAERALETQNIIPTGFSIVFPTAIFSFNSELGVFEKNPSVPPSSTSVNKECWLLCSDFGKNPEGCADMCNDSAVRTTGGNSGGAVNAPPCDQWVNSNGQTQCTVGGPGGITQNGACPTDRCGSISRTSGPSVDGGARPNPYSAE